MKKMKLSSCVVYLLFTFCRFLAHESVTVFRFPDHGIFHRWHPKKCDLTTRDEMRRKRCLSTKFMFEASHEDLAAEYFKHKEK